MIYIIIPVKYDILSNTPPVMPLRLPGFIKDTICKVPEHMKPAAANGLFAPAAEQMSNTTFTYWDNKRHEPAVMEGCVSPSGVGKGYLDDLYEAMIRHQRQHDVESREQLAEYARQVKSASANQKKPERPKVSILVPEPDMTNPALIQLLQNAELDGDKPIYCNISEIDLLDQCCGSHKKVTKVIRLNFDSRRYGAERATVDGISGNPILRWRFNFSCVESKAQTFFKDCLTDGTLFRCGFSYIQRPANRRMKPKQGTYDAAYYKTLDDYLLRLRTAQGNIEVPSIDKVILRLQEELADIADLADDDTFQAIYNRALVVAWLKGCILYVAEGYRWSKTIADFIEWSLCYNIWSQIALFAPQLRKADAAVTIDVKHHGPQNMLAKLPDTFSRVQLESLRQQMDMPTDCTKQLRNWNDRGYIIYSESTKLYAKTQKYFDKHPAS